ncbi:MAG TPA: DUF1565 domain-containing protein, partial [Mucilaginibacter sp.]
MKRYINIFLMHVFAVQAIACSKKTAGVDVTPETGNTHVYYVSVNGSDANSGKINAPFQTINTALSHAIPGDTVMVRGGVYYD